LRKKRKKSKIKIINIFLIAWYLRSFSIV
jgi:hypothetical protein